MRAMLLVTNAVRQKHGSHSFWVRPVRQGSGRLISVKALAKRLDQAIDDWRGYLYASSKPRLPGFVKPATTRPFNVPYLPGRTPLHPQLKEILEGRLNDELESLVSSRYLPASLRYLFQTAWRIVWQDAADFNLPYLVVEKALLDIMRAAFDHRQIDLYLDLKQRARGFVNERSCLATIQDDIARAKNPLLRGLEIALAGNSLGRVETTALATGVRVLDLVSGSWSFYQDMREQAVAKLSGAPLNIVYILDNAGESILDLLFIDQLLSGGHSVTLVAKALPALNDETAAEFSAYLDKRMSYAKNPRVLAGWDIPGIDLLSTPPEVAQALGTAKLVIVKGEGNFEGMPPEHDYSFDVLYVLKHKTPGLDHRIGSGNAGPEKGQGIIYYKQAREAA